MRRAFFTAIALMSFSTATPSWAADEFCKQVKAFEQSPLAKLPDDGFQRRWIDFIWGNPGTPQGNEEQIGPTLKCYGSDDTAKALCRYFLPNTSFENISVLPRHILRCHGFDSRWPRQSSRWVQEFSWEAPNELIERLQIDELGRPDHEPAIRLTIMPYPESPEAKRPEPFFKALSTKLDLYEGDD